MDGVVSPAAFQEGVRMKRFAIAILMAVATVIVTASAHAQNPVANAKIALHVKPFDSSKACGTKAPTGACDTYTDTVPAGTSEAPIEYMVYIVPVMDIVATTEANGGFTGCGFGIQYEPYADNAGTRTGMLVDQWSKCTASLDIPDPIWPETNSGIVLTWTACQTTASIANSTQSLAGYFRVRSFSPATLYIIRRPTVEPSGRRIEITTCEPPQGGLSMDIPSNQVGFIQFAADTEQGCNPCVDAECIGVATTPTTWGNIKNTFGGE
jgi:hypothetical protein